MANHLDLAMGGPEDRGGLTLGEMESPAWRAPGDIDPGKALSSTKWRQPNSR